MFLFSLLSVFASLRDNHILIKAYFLINKKTIKNTLLLTKKITTLNMKINSDNLAILKIRDYQFNWTTKTYLMGIINVTPDSFSDGGDFENVNSAFAQSIDMIKNGADIIDIGGQSTRPNADQITLKEELNRVIPIIKKIRENSLIPISIDTTRSEVARLAIEAGADMVNDISAGMFDEQMFSTVAKLNVPLILMHIRGNPKTMQNLTNYDDLIGEIYHFFENRINQAIKAGIWRSHLIIDPGIGFAKTWDQNIEILQKLPSFKSLNLPILIGTSRKSFIGQIIGENDPKKRVWGTCATCCVAIEKGANILRVHDVKAISDVAKVADIIYRN